ncbi:2-oxoglutarate dehydrogenase E1 subunit family protein, partial [Streptomyces calidiresistens]|uniref:2-oxoglutarate dehydrogenase E1 subunit family protein n=1 Tax=Streptomyces calidiresistens TaxID=1485586 RepID=UPI003F692378
MSPQSPNTSSVSTDQAGSGNGPAAGFGANEWLVDEIYQQYLQDPNSVDRAWWDFFADYRPGSGNGKGEERPDAKTPAGTDAPTPAVTEKRSGDAPGTEQGTKAPAADASAAESAAPAAPAAPPKAPAK